MKLPFSYHVLAFAITFLAQMIYCQPTFSFFSMFNKREATNGSQSRISRIAVKPYSGIKLRQDSVQAVYYCDQTIAIAELGPGKELLNCELIEVVDSQQALDTLKKLSRISPSMVITLPEMMDLMRQCQKVEDYLREDKYLSALLISSESNAPSNQPAVNHTEKASGKRSNSPLSLFKGIVPGTKWCGTGDIARNFHDVGPEQADRCCRNHDICPVKVQSYQTRYNLTNKSIYTKSYCDCDDMLYNCLKRANTSTSQLLGNIYFNLIQAPCIAEKEDGTKTFVKTAREF